MHRLYHLWLSPFCRKVRVAMAEKKLDLEPRIEKIWDRREGFLALNPMGKVPVLETADGPVLCDSSVITEYLEEVYPEPPLLGRDPIGRAETRRLIIWFDEKFNAEVTRHLVYEKIISACCRSANRTPRRSAPGTATSTSISTISAG